MFKQVKYAQHGGSEEENSENCGKLQQTQGNYRQFPVKSVELLAGLSPTFNEATIAMCILILMMRVTVVLWNKYLCLIQ